MGSNRSIVRSAGLIGFATFLSRVLGLIRDILSAKIFGTSWVYDAFLMAFTIPNLLKRLLGEGALSSSFVPVFTGYLEKRSNPSAWRLASIVASWITLLSLVLVIAGIVGITEILRIVSLEPKFKLMLLLLRILLPFLLLTAWSSWTMGVLNSYRHFWTPALAPLFLNLGWIGALVWLCPLLGEQLDQQVYGLTWGLLIGGVIQCVVQIPPLWQRKPSLHWEINYRHEGAREIGHLWFPSIFGLAVTQLSLTVDLYFGYLLGEGATSSLWYANRLMQFPLGIFAAAMGTAVLPTFSAQAANERFDQFRETLGFSLRLLTLIVIPASVGLIFLREPIVRLLFERDQFGSDSTVRVASVLMYYCLGLFFYSGIKVLTSAFYSLKDTKTPVKAGFFGLALNVMLNAILMWPLRESGIALATAISSGLNFVVLLILLLRRVGGLDLKRFFDTLWRVGIAAGFMGIGSFWVSGHCTAYALWVQVVAAITGGILFFIMASVFLRVPEVKMALKLLQR